MLLDALVTAQEERQEHRADVVDVAEVEDEALRRVGLERRQDHLGGLLHEVFGQFFHFRRRRDHRDVAVAFDPDVLRRVGHRGTRGSEDRGRRNYQAITPTPLVKRVCRVRQR